MVSRLERFHFTFIVRFQLFVLGVSGQLVGGCYNGIDAHPAWWSIHVYLEVDQGQDTVSLSFEMVEMTKVSLLNDMNMYVYSYHVILICM